MLVLGGLLSVGTAILGLALGFGDEWNSRRDRAFWFLFSLGGPALLVGGLWLAIRRPSGAAIAGIVVGALFCGIATFWSVLIPLAAIAVAAMAIMWGRRPTVV